jgi:hypothetical protein
MINIEKTKSNDLVELKELNILSLFNTLKPLSIKLRSQIIKFIHLIEDQEYINLIEFLQLKNQKEN